MNNTIIMGGIAVVAAIGAAILGTKNSTKEAAETTVEVEENSKTTTGATVGDALNHLTDALMAERRAQMEDNVSDEDVSTIAKGVGIAMILTMIGIYVAADYEHIKSFIKKKLASIKTKKEAKNNG